MNDNKIVDIKTCKVENINEENYKKQIDFYKKYLLEEIDENDLDDWLMQYQNTKHALLDAFRKDF